MAWRSGSHAKPLRCAAGRSRVATAAGIVLAVVMCAPGALAYFEDLDTPTSHSTFHYELVRLLARAAGFSVADAEMVAVACQAVDLGTFTGDQPGSPTVTITGTGRLDSDTAKYFHFPRRPTTTSAGTPYPSGRDTCANFATSDDPCPAGVGEVRTLELWAISAGATLSVTVPTAAVNGAPAADVEGGTLLALGVYLHSLADSYSHEKCGQDAQARRHCLPATSGCTTSCMTQYWHGQAEYGSGGAGVPFTKEAGRAVWQELKRYRQVRGLPGGPLWEDATAEAFIDSWAETSHSSARADAAASSFNAIATCTLGCSAGFTAEAGTSLAVAFEAATTPTDCAEIPTYDWEFGDGSAHGTEAAPLHTYASAGSYTWTVVVSQDGATCSATGALTVPASRLRRHFRSRTD